MKVRINEAEEILKGAEKLSAQLNKSEWAKMPKVKEETVKEKQYVVTQDIWGIKKEDIEVCPGAPTRFIFDIESGAGALYINSKNITKFIEQGIIAEKKSKAEIIKENLIEGADKLSAQLNKSEWAKMPGDEMNTEEEKSYYNGYTEDKPDLNQDIFNYIHNLTGSTLLFDELGGLISIFEKHGWDKKVWQKEKPGYPCLFVARDKEMTDVFTLEESGSITKQSRLGKYVVYSLTELQADEYFVIERF